MSFALRILADPFYGFHARLIIVRCERLPHPLLSLGRSQRAQGLDIAPILVVALDENRLDLRALGFRNRAQGLQIIALAVMPHGIFDDHARDEFVERR